MVTILPSLASGLFGGVLADRVDRRALLIGARGTCSTIAFALAAVILTGHANVWLVILLATAASIAFAIDAPGQQAVLPNIVPPQDLLSAAGLTRASMQVAYTVGPLIAGLMVTPIGVGGVLLVKASLDAASTVALRARVRSRWMLLRRERASSGPSVKGSARSVGIKWSATASSSRPCSPCWCIRSCR